MSDKTDGTSLGDRMKAYEAPTTQRVAFKGQPLVVRLDGKSFHTWTKGLKRPYDERLSDLMVTTMRSLVAEFHPLVGYTQSDEITLVFYVAPHWSHEYPYGGRIQKIESLMAAFCSATFNAQAATFGLGEHASRHKKLAIFDARAFVVPNIREAYHAVLWRQQDATKNAISMAAHAHFSHSSLQGLHGPQMQERLWAEKGINFNDYPFFFKRGTFARRITTLREMTTEDCERIPEAYWPANGKIKRTEVLPFDCWLTKEEDPIKTLFGIDGMVPGSE